MQKFSSIDELQKHHMGVSRDRKKTEWYMIPCMCPCVLSCFSHDWLFVTPRTITYQAPQSMGFSRQEYWGGLPCPPPGHLPYPGIEPPLLHLLHYRWILYCWATGEAHDSMYMKFKNKQRFCSIKSGQQLDKEGGDVMGKYTESGTGARKLQFDALLCNHMTLYTLWSICSPIYLVSLMYGKWNNKVYFRKKIIY